MPKLIDITGHKYGFLTVLGISHRNDRGIILWDCLCDCGNEIKTYSNNLRSGNAKSCGCYHKKVVSNSSRKHGMSRSDENKIYRSIKDRCTNPLNKRYQSYGGRGIRICERWLGDDGFENFFNDMGVKPFVGASIDRIDNNKGYSPENCRWADSVTQSHNTRIRKDNKSGVKGVSFDKAKNKWVARMSYKGKRILNKTVATFEEACQIRKKFYEAIIAAHEGE